MDVLGRLGLEESAYKATLLKQGQGLSVKDFEGAVAVNLVRDGWAALRESMVEKAPDLLFDLVIFHSGATGLSRLVPSDPACSQRCL